MKKYFSNMKVDSNNAQHKYPTRLHRVGKKPSVKADLAIYSHAV